MVEVVGGDDTSFLYDADGRRVRRQSGDTTTYYVTGGEVSEVAGGPLVFLDYFSLGGDTVAYSADGVLTWLFKDQVSPSSVSLTAAGVKKTQRYMPFGEFRDSDVGLTTDRGFTGQVAMTVRGCISITPVISIRWLEGLFLRTRLCRFRWMGRITTGIPMCGTIPSTTTIPLGIAVCRVRLLRLAVRRLVRRAAHKRAAHKRVARTMVMFRRVRRLV